MIPRCTECGRKALVPGTVAYADAKTNLWRMRHGEEIGYSDSAKAVVRSRYCNTCGVRIDPRRSFYRTPTKDSNQGLEP